MAPRSDTIVAISSAPGRAGVAVIRISGQNAMVAASAMTGTLPSARRASLRDLRDPRSGELLDRAIVLVFPGPQSFTGEDVVEMHVHGSIAVQRAVLAALTQLDDVRPAKSGEFTRRAWINGRMGLIDVEALSDLLAAETESQRRLALQSRRRLEDHAASWRSQLLSLRAMAEAEIDFMDEADVAARLDSDSERSIDALLSEMERAIETFRVAERIRTGLRVAILGPPNAGKSSLMNAFAKRDIAITSPIPGTTRDSIEAFVDLDGVAVCFVDTAGIRVAGDVIESEGIARSWRSSQTADVTLWLSPADSPATSPDDRFVTVISKSDLDDVPTEALAVSSVGAPGLQRLIAYLRNVASNGLIDTANAVFLSTERQSAELGKALAALRRARAVPGSEIELRAEECRLAIDALDSLVGRVAVEDILGEIFSRFCVGK